MGWWAVLSFWPGWDAPGCDQGGSGPPWVVGPGWSLKSVHRPSVTGLSYRPAASGRGLHLQFESRISATVIGKPYSFIILLFIPMAAGFQGSTWESFKSVVVSYSVSFI